MKHIRKFKEFINESFKNYQFGTKYNVGTDLEGIEDMKIMYSEESNRGRGGEPYRICLVGKDLYLTYDYNVIDVEETKNDIIDEFEDNPEIRKMALKALEDVVMLFKGVHRNLNLPSNPFS